MPQTPAALSRFIERVEQRYSRDRVESFWELQADFLALLRSGVVVEWFNRELRELARDLAYMGDWQPNQLILHRGRGYALSIWLFDRPRQYLHSLPFLGLYAPIGNESLRYARYRLPPDYRNDVFDPTVRLLPDGDGATAPGEVLALHGDDYVYDFKTERPLPVVKFTTAATQPMEWLFNRDTLYAWQANDSTLDSTQLRVAAYVLGRLASASSVEPLNFLATHAHHAVRWAAIQGLGRISRSAALARLEQATRDPHPHVRRAAAKTLQQLGVKTA